MEIAAVAAQSPLLDAVKALWRKESKRLGFLPEGAFQEAAGKERVIAALEEGGLAGYVLYRLSHGRVIITHLAVAPAGRGRGTGRALVEHLSRSHPQAAGVGLLCRRDYPASAFWPKVGFVARHERPGRGQEGSRLTYWWRDHGHPGLFSRPENADRDGEIIAAIDANVFFDLVGPYRPQGQESLALRADWLQEEVRLRVTDEIFNDLNRDSDEGRRERRRQTAEGAYEPICAAPEEVESKRGLLRALFPDKIDVQTASDLGHLARAAASDVPYFLTRDEDLLRLGAGIAEAVGLTVLAPTEFINRLDQLRREASYRPVRLAGGTLHLALVRGEEVDELSRIFGGQAGVGGPGGPTELRERLRDLLCRPGAITCQAARAEDGSPQALVAYRLDAQKSADFEVVLFVVRADNAAADTVARYLLHRLILQAAGRGSRLLRLTEAVPNAIVHRAAGDCGFVIEADGALVKYCRRVVAASGELADELDSCTVGPAVVGPGNPVGLSVVGMALRRPENIGDTSTASALEGVLWPAKLADAALPTFILPIQPRWAERLFDEDLAGQNLFGVGQGRLMAREGVYYRSAQRAGLVAPARLLWYVSADAGFPGSKALRACSAVEEIVVGAATEVYKRFRRLGVYRWADVLAHAKGDAQAPVMAVRFVNTEPFSHPLPWSRLAGLGVRGPLQGPRRIGPEVFSALYRAGMGL